MKTNQLIAQLKVTLNSESHTPQEWDMYARQLAELSRKAHSRIMQGVEGKRADNEKK